MKAKGKKYRVTHRVGYIADYTIPFVRNKAGGNHACMGIKCKGLADRLGEFELELIERLEKGQE